MRAVHIKHCRTTHKEGSMKTLIKILSVCFVLFLVLSVRITPVTSSSDEQSLFTDTLSVDLHSQAIADDDKDKDKDSDDKDKDKDKDSDDKDKDTDNSADYYKNRPHVKQY